MKRIAVLFFVLFSALTAFTQVYAEGKMLSQLEKDNSVIIYVPSPTCITKAMYKIPEKCKLFGKNYSVITDESGKVILFRTVAGVIEHFVSNGWEYVDSFSLISGSDPIYTRFYIIFHKAENDTSAENFE